jgi:hypothetical protein
VGNSDTFLNGDIEYTARKIIKNAGRIYGLLSFT